MADPETISYQTQQVTTEVFPSEMGEGEIPWWVWLLAALLGLLLLSIITLCLYKVISIFLVGGCVIKYSNNRGKSLLELWVTTSLPD